MYVNVYVCVLLCMCEETGSETGSLNERETRKMKEASV